MQSAKPFSIAAMVRAIVSGTYGKVESNESRAVADEIEKHGLPDNGYEPLPWNALGSRATPLTAAIPSNGGYLDQTAVQGYIPQLLPMTTLGRLGATPVSLGKNSTLIPYGAEALVPTWLSNETTATDATSPAFGQVTAVRHTILTCTSVSRQLLLQSNIDDILTLELRRATAAAIDAAGIAGNGTGGMPLGLLNIAAIPSASGATLAYPALVSMMQAVANANAVHDLPSLGFLTSPNVAAALKQRYFSEANLPIWVGSIPAGEIDEQLALSSTSVPSALIHGDFSNLLVAGWSDGISMAVDPFTQFTSGTTMVRLCVSVDFVLPNPTAFSILTAVS
jgi:HK97 family phage major capsid protein